MLTVGSTFTGVGGADLGLERAGFSVAWQCELDAWKRSVLAAHWPSVPIHEDITTLHDPAPVDLLIGGFPCQDLSVAGKRKGFSGERSVLAFEFLRLAESLRPRWLLLENVPGLLSSNSGRDLARLLDEVGAIGYGWAFRILDARYFGVPQRRRRVFICARRADADIDPRAASELALRALWESSDGDPTPGWPARENTPTSIGSGTPSGGEVAGSLTKRYGKGINTTCDDGAMIVTAFGHTQGIDIQPSTTATPTLRKNGGGGGVATTQIVNALDRQAGGPDDNSAQAGHLIPTAFSAGQSSTAGSIGYETGMSPTLRASASGTNQAPTLHEQMSVRRLTPLECERLMGWPDNWTAPEGVKASDSKRYAACGDGIVSHVAYWIGCRIKMIEEEA